MPPRRRDASIRDLYYLTRDYTGAALSDEVIVPWVAESEYGAWLALAGVPEARTDKTVNTEELYALSRLLDALILPFQPINMDPAVFDAHGQPRWEGSIPPVDALPAFMAALGAHAVWGAPFHPFFHEVVGVVPAEDSLEPATVVQELWPAHFMGHLLLQRGGAVIRAGSAVIDPELGTRSRLYWAWWRRNRPTADLSHGWGHNSQWGTDFRRDYFVDDTIYYNVDGPGADPEPDEDWPDPPVEQMNEIVRHRCSTTTDLSHVTPWDWTYQEPVPWA